ncbi:hypothetical protein, partial [Escherichia coli]|uniref:hypothetical protein n=1 Tax=Escherichia coli TaxID=562 RepID=UPI000B3EEEBE
MSGKPAARQGDMTQYGGSIVQGSAGVRIGAPTGVACSVCPGGVTSGHPASHLPGPIVPTDRTEHPLPAPPPPISLRPSRPFPHNRHPAVGSLR